MKTIILGKRSLLSQRLNKKIDSSEILNYDEFRRFNYLNKKKFNLIINSFYPSAKLNNISSFKNFYNQSLGNLSLILDNINTKKINKIIYSSSASVYGSINEKKINEDNNRSLYASAKLTSETLLNNFCKKNKLQLIVARVFNMYGDNDNFSIIQKLVEVKKKKRKIQIFNNGNAIRDFIHVDDVCEIYSKFLITKESSTFDVGSGYGIRIKDIIDFLNIPKNKIVYKKSGYNEINSSIANNHKINTELNKNNFYRLEDFFKKKLKLISNNKKILKIQREYPNTINNYLSGSIIYGCGFAGKRIAKKLIKLNVNNVIYFVDDNPELIGKKYLGKKIISKDQLLNLSKTNVISNIIIAIPSISQSKLINLYNQLFPLTLNITSLPAKQNLIKKNEVIIEDLKNLELGDILKRKIFDINKKSIEYFKNKSVLITGGAGSIGSEISKQLFRAKPKKLVIVDNSEYNLFKIKQKLGVKKNLKYLLLDINYQNEIKQIIKKNKINFIFHAAAYKHVNILEDNVISAVRNNIFATLSILKVIKNTNINLTIISTDKAVKPKNVLGFTKRASEIIALSFSEQKDYKNSKISIVRFGNVFGSSGSAVEIFKNQIQNNLPITLTDNKMTRFFMSIKEACNLVIQASQLKYNNSIFVLDMGKQVRIVEIIKKIHSLVSNKRQKLNIKIIGKTKAEKINETLSYKSLKKTSIKDISIANEKTMKINHVNSFIKKLEHLLNISNKNKIIKLIKKFSNFKN